MINSDRMVVDEIQARRAGAIYSRIRREFEDGFMNRTDFEDGEWDTEQDRPNEDDLRKFMREGCPEFVGAEDLRHFASHNASPDYMSVSRRTRNTVHLLSS